MASLFNTEQPAVNPVTAGVNPVVDNSLAAGIGAATSIAVAAGEAQDQMLLSDFASDLDTLAAETPNDILNFQEQVDVLSDLSSEDKETVRQADVRLRQLTLAATQRMGSSENLEARKADLLRRTIRDKPWLAAELRGLAATYNVGGTGGGQRTGKSASEKAVDAVWQKATELSLIGVPVDKKVQLLQQAMLTEAQWAMLNQGTQAVYEGNLMDRAAVGAGEANVALGGYIESLNQPGAVFDKNYATSLIDSVKAKVLGDMRGVINRARMNGQPVEVVNDNHLKTLVDEQFAPLLSAIESKDPVSVRERMTAYNELLSLQTRARAADLNPLLGVIMDLMGAKTDPQNQPRAIELFGRMERARKKFGGDIPESALADNPEWRAAWDLYKALPKTFFKQVEQKHAEGSVGDNPAQVEATKSLLGALVQGGDSPAMWAAFNAAVNSESTVLETSVLENTPPDGKLPPEVETKLVAKMEFGEAASQDKFTEYKMRRVSVTPAPVPVGNIGESLRALVPESRDKTVQQYELNFNPTKGKFELWNLDEEGKRTGEFKPMPVANVLPSTLELRRSLDAVNLNYKVRQKYGLWPTSKQAWVQSILTTAPRAQAEDIYGRDANTDPVAREVSVQKFVEGAQISPSISSTLPTEEEKAAFRSTVNAQARERLLEHDKVMQQARDALLNAGYNVYLEPTGQEKPKVEVLPASADKPSESEETIEVWERNADGKLERVR